MGRTIPWITGGEPTWAGQSLSDCQNYIITYGFRAFDREMQQNVQDVEGALLSTETINETRLELDDIPALTRVAVAVDPASTSKSTSNETGIIGCGRCPDRHGYVLADESGVMAPALWGRKAVLLLDRLREEHDCEGVIVAEKNNGGEMVELVIKTAAEKLHAERLRQTKDVVVKLVHASKGKRARAEPVAQMYEEHSIHHVGAFDGLETQWTTWDASSGDESPDRIDAEVWGMTELGILKHTSNASTSLASERGEGQILSTLINESHGLVSIR